jgi:hypothetical protein
MSEFHGGDSWLLHFPFDSQLFEVDRHHSHACRTILVRILLSLRGIHIGNSDNARTGDHNVPSRDDHYTRVRGNVYLRGIQSTIGVSHDMMMGGVDRRRMKEFF